MDPNLFHLDWNRTLEAVVGVIVLAFLVERVAALLFESRWWVHSTKTPDDGSEESERERRNMDIASRIIQARDDLDEIRRIASEMRSDSPLWPPEPEEPGRLVERARRHLDKTRDLRARRSVLRSLPIKEAGAFALAAALCWALTFDAFAIILLQEKSTLWGLILTGAVVAGGSKAAIRLFHDLLGVRSNALRAMRPPEKDKQGDGS